MSKSEVNEVILVGGSTLIPKIQNMIKDLFHGKKPVNSIDPNFVIACGAAVQASYINK